MRAVVIGRSALIVLVAALSCAAQDAEPWAWGEALPDGVAARIGDDAVAEAELVLTLHRRFAHRREGLDTLNELIKRSLVERELERRRISIPDADVDAEVRLRSREYVEATGGAVDLDRALARRGLTQLEFRRRIRSALGIRRLAGATPDAVDVAAIERRYVRDRLAIAHVERDPSRLGPGEAARVDGRAIATRAFVATLLPALPRADVAAAVNAVLQSRLALALCAERKVEVDARALADYEAAARARFLAEREQPEVHFEDFVRRATGMPLTTYRESHDFRREVALARLGDALVPEARLEAAYRDQRRHYGPIRVVRHLFLRAADEADPAVGIRSRVAADALLRDWKQAAGSADDFAAMVAERSEDPGARVREGLLGRYTPEQLAELEPSLRDAITAAEPGAVVGPIASEVGVHLLMVIRIEPIPLFDPAIARDLRRRAAIDLFQARWDAVAKGVDLRALVDLKAGGSER